MSKEKKETKETKALNIYQKLLEVRKQCEYIQKSSSGFKFKYANETEILKAIRPEMDRQGLLLGFTMEKPELNPDNKFVQVGFKFTWINVDNPEERIENTIYLQTVAGDPQKIGGLMTYATRYYLYKFFNVATDDMDLDTYHNMTGKITAEQVAMLEEMINGDQDIRDKMLKWAQADNLAGIHANKLERFINGINHYRKEKQAKNQEAENGTGN